MVEPALVKVTPAISSPRKASGWGFVQSEEEVTKKPSQEVEVRGRSATPKVVSPSPKKASVKKTEQPSYEKPKSAIKTEAKPKSVVKSESKPKSVVKAENKPTPAKETAKPTPAKEEIKASPAKLEVKA